MGQFLYRTLLLEAAAGIELFRTGGRDGVGVPDLTRHTRNFSGFVLETLIFCHAVLRNHENGVRGCPTTQILLTMP